jgi:hypothetical protein
MFDRSSMLSQDKQLSFLRGQDKPQDSSRLRMIVYS